MCTITNWFLPSQFLRQIYFISLIDAQLDQLQAKMRHRIRSRGQIVTIRKTMAIVLRACQARPEMKVHNDQSRAIKDTTRLKILLTDFRIVSFSESYPSWSELHIFVTSKYIALLRMGRSVSYRVYIHQYQKSRNGKRMLAVFLFSFRSR